MIGFAQGVVISLTWVLTGLLLNALHDPAGVSSTNALLLFGLAFGGWIAISSWKEMRLKLRSKKNEAQTIDLYLGRSSTDLSGPGSPR
jgi:hypothetical protein